MRNVNITAVGAYVPPRVMTNKDFEKIVDTSDEWILERTGIRERHIAPPEMATSDLALEAAKDCLAARGVSAEDLDAIILCTVTPDHFFPSTACLVQHRLGAKRAWGFDLIAAAFEDIMAGRTQLAALGAGERKYHELFTARSEQRRGRVGVRLGFDDGLAHRIEAGADIFLMPSLYEPCGLNQMISLKYGTVPVVRATGGLDDTVTPWDPKSGRGNGFKFSPYSSEAMVKCLREALDVFTRPEDWKKLIRNGMREDHSWSASAREYQTLFAEVTGLKPHQAKPRTEEKPTPSLPPTEPTAALPVKSPPPSLPSGEPAKPAAKPGRKRKTAEAEVGAASSDQKPRSRKRAAAKPVATKKKLAKKPASRGRETETDQ